MIALPPDRPIAFSLSYLDRSADPGSDFYQFATGSWSRDNPVPPDQSFWGAGSELRKQNRLRLRAIADRACQPADSPSLEVREVGTFYAAALNREERSRQAFGPIRDQISRCTQIASLDDVFRTVAELHEQGVGAMFTAEVDSDLRNSRKYAFYLFQGGLSLPDREYYLAGSFAKVRKEFLRHVARVFELTGETPPEAERRAQSVLGLETELARVSRPRADLRDLEKNYHRFSIDEIVARYPSLPWKTYLTVRKADLAGYLVIGQPEFFVTLERLVTFDRLADWQVYLQWQVLHAAAPTLHAAVDQEDFAFFHRVLLGQPQPEPDWELAVQATDECLGEALGHLYVDQYFPPEARQRMAVLVSDLMAVFHDRLMQLDWMTDETRKRALAKFARFSPMIGSPARFRDYSAIVLRRDEYSSNVLRARSFEIRRRMARIGGPVVRTDWLMSPPTVDAYHDPCQLNIVFPAGMLQPPYFDVTMDDAVNYGAIGAVIGHEITHGFDDQGRRFDAEGNMTDWWTEADAHEFVSRATEVEKEYSQLEILPGVHVNGRLTLGENIADIGGVSIAFEALQRRLSADPTRRRTIDGFTPEQRFCLSWAQAWRSNMREEETRRRITVDPHSPRPLRAVVPLWHLPAFFEAFPQKSDPLGSKPDKPRVRIW